LSSIPRREERASVLLREARWQPKLPREILWASHGTVVHPEKFVLCTRKIVPARRPSLGLVYKGVDGGIDRPTPKSRTPFDSPMLPGDERLGNGAGFAPHVPVDHAG
jgi:hypothetical protein